MDKLLKTALKHSEEAEIYRQDNLQTLVCFSDNRLESVETTENIGLALRLIQKGRLGQCASSNLNDVNTIAKRASEIAQYGDNITYHFPTQGSYPKLDLCDKSVVDISVEEMINRGRKLISIITDYDKNILASCNVIKEKSRMEILNSAGLSNWYERACISLLLGGKLTEERNILQIFKALKSLHPIKDDEALARECVEDFKIARKNVPFSSGKARVIFTPAALADLFNAFIGGVSGDRVAKGLSPLTGKIGQKILDSRVTIVDDGVHPEGTLSAPMDDEGIPAHKTPIIEKGILKNYITNLKAASELGGQSSGNGLRETPLDRVRTYTAGVSLDFTNVILEPGIMSYKEMLEKTNIGLEIHYMTGILLGNLMNGHFSGSLELAYKIENGKRVGRVKDTMISGNFYDLFRDHLIDLSREVYWTGSFGGETGSFLCPYGYFQDVDISAG